MTFFNKKTEVMQIEMTPYGRYLYSIGKFKPHSYEFVDDDILYKSGSVERPESIHNRITNETPKLKINRAFQDEAPRVENDPPVISVKREMRQKMDQKQNGLYAMGRSSYSSDKLPNFQVSMLRGEIYKSFTTHQVNSSPTGLPQRLSPSPNLVIVQNTKSGSIHIPQIFVDFTIRAEVKNALNEAPRSLENTSRIFEDGRYYEISLEDPIIHLKEFNSFYERENFDIEFFEVLSNERLRKMKLMPETTSIINDMLVDGEPRSQNTEDTDFSELFDEYEYEAAFYDDSYFEYFFSIENDEGISRSELCKVVDSLEINDQFIDEELICPDKRTNRFDIYATRVGPDDLEDCD